MKPPTKNSTVRFSTRGRVTIPAEWRRRYGIEDGARVMVEVTPDGILFNGPVVRRC